MLFTMLVSSGQHSYTVQHEVPTVPDAIPALLQSESFRQFATARFPTASPFTPNDVFLFIPVEGLRNAWVAQGGREGTYFTVILVRTHSPVGDDVEQSVAPDERARSSKPSARR